MTLSASKVAVHPASHNFPMKIRELCVRPGRIHASRASFGSWGRSKLHVVLVERKLAPLGRPTVMGALVVPSNWYGSFVHR
jgi:hypothetical protein